MGCRLEMDNLGSEEYPICTTVREILKLKDEYDKTWDMKQSRLVNHTGCFPPCNYAEYQLAMEPLKYKEKGGNYKKRCQEIVCSLLML